MSVLHASRQQARRTRELLAELAASRVCYLSQELSCAAGLTYCILCTCMQGAKNAMVQIAVAYCDGLLGRSYRHIKYLHEIKVMVIPIKYRCIDILTPMM